MKVLFQTGFTLLELLIVIGIMGLLGTVSVSGFRGLKAGMEERGAMQVVDEFVRSAYRRAIIDRTPTAIYFWNETVNDETVGEKLEIVGRAVAVRRAGRISAKDGQFLIDEFGDLAYDTARDEEGEVDENSNGYKNDPGRYLYKMGESSFARSVVSSSTVRRSLPEYLTTRPNRTPEPKIRAYGYYLRDAGGVDWKVGNPYGFEFAELTLGKNFIFGSTYSENAKLPEKQISMMTFSPTGTIGGNGAGGVEVSALKLDKSGAITFKSIGKSSDPKQKR